MITSFARFADRPALSFLWSFLPAGNASIHWLFGTTCFTVSTSLSTTTKVLINSNFIIFFSNSSPSLASSKESIRFLTSFKKSMKLWRRTMLKVWRQKIKKRTKIDLIFFYWTMQWNVILFSKIWTKSFSLPKTLRRFLISYFQFTLYILQFITISRNQK